MGLVYKGGLTYEQQRTQLQTQETETALREVKENLRAEQNSRANDDAVLRQDISALRGVVTAEIDSRSAAQTQIQADLLTETNQRTASDAELRNSINSEIAAREELESTLRDDFESAIDTEKAERAQAIQDMAAALSVAMGNAQRLQEIENENLRRQMEADASAQGTTLAALNERIETEEQSRAAQDTKLSNAIAAEESARKSAVNSLQTSLTSTLSDEATARQNADTQLQNSFNSALATEVQNRNNALNALDSSLKNYVDNQLSDVAGSLNDFTAPTETTDGKRGLVPNVPKGTGVKILTSAGWRDLNDATLTVGVVPSQVGSLTYNGAAQSPTWLNFDDKKLSISGQISASDAGTFTATFTPLDLYVWEDTRDQSPKTASWQILPLKLPKPSAPVTAFTFNGAAQSINVSNFDATYISQSGNVSATNAGTYSAVYKLKNTSNTKWSDNSVADVTINWNIAALKLAKPTAAVTEFLYDGAAKSLNVSNFDATYISQSGSVSASAVGNYSAVYKLKNTSNTKWSDNSVADVTINWVIKQSILTAEQSTGFAQVGSLTYSGSTQNLTVQNFDSTLHTLSGTTSATKAGNYTAFVSPKSGCMWADGSNAPKEVNWSIKPLILQKPVAASTEFTCDGSTKSLQIDNYISTYMTRTGTVSAAKVGIYSVTYTLKSVSNYTWADSSTEPVVIEWQIVTLKLPKPSASSTSFIYGGDTKSLSIQNFDTTYISRSGTVSATNAGTYSVTFSLKNTDRTEWADGATDDVIINWKIERKKLTAAQSNFTAPQPVTFNAEDIWVSDFLVAEDQKAFYVFGGVQYASDVGNYVATVAPQSNYAWSDGSTAPKEVNWSIVARVIPKINVQDNQVFTYNGWHQHPDWGEYDSKFINSVNDYGGFSVGDYQAKFYHKYNSPGKINTVWSDGTTDILVFNWSIVKIRLSDNFSAEGPYSFVDNFTYYTVVINGYDSSVHTQGGDWTKNSPGVYTALIKLKSPETTCWDSDGSSDDRAIQWEILPLYVDMPTVGGDTEFTYDGTLKTLQVDNFNPSKVNRSGTVTATDVGAYSVKFTLGMLGYSWRNGTRDPIIFNWSIGLTKVSLPTLQTSSLVYDGNSKSPVFQNFDDSLLTKTGDTSAVNAGNYTIRVALKDKNATCWEDGSTDDKLVYWSVSRALIPSTYNSLAQSGTLTFDGNSKTVSISGYSPSYHSLSGVYVATDAGSYVAKITPLENYQWRDGTTVTKSVVWNIKPIKIAKPSASSTAFAYDKQAHSLNLSNFNAAYISQSGTVSATDAGDYTAVFKLNDIRACW